MTHNVSTCVHTLSGGSTVADAVCLPCLSSPCRHLCSDCTHELFAVQCALRLALCTPPAPSRRHGRCKRDSETPSSLLTEPVSHRAHAALLIGHLVEIGAPGWRETKAIMVPPLPQLMQAAEAPSGSEGAATFLSDSRWVLRVASAIV